MSADLYTSAAWRHLSDRARARDGHRCTVARLLGGPCSARLDCHHLVPVTEGGDALDIDNVITVCASHHPMLEALRRYVVKRRAPRRCRHHHPYPQGRRECEARMAREAA